MSRVRSTKRNLIGGVSQQPVETRLDSQCERQDNAYSSVIDGLIKRHPTQHIARLDTGTSGFSTLFWEGRRVHFIDRSPTERYVMIFDPVQFTTAGFKVFSADDGTEMDITGPSGGAIPSGAKAYVSGTDDSLDVLTLRDTTYVVNKATVCAKDTTQISDAFDINGGSGAAVNQSASSRRRFIFIRSTNYLRRYAVRLVVTDTSDNEIPNNNTAAQRELNVAWVKTWDGMGTPANGKTGFEAIYGNDKDIPPYDPDNAASPPEPIRKGA
ncbi:MAG TPA: hypothetical protein VMW94_03955, partial [Actinomycetes bacterium]|nr:hypothetical protein [Actinomycetes bacterium]